MKTMKLEAAAQFLGGMNEEVLRRKAKAGLIPGAKPGKHWLFAEENLVRYLAGDYDSGRREPKPVGENKTNRESKKCRSTNAVKRGGSRTQTETANEYGNLLELKTKSKPKNTMTA